MSRFLSRGERLSGILAMSHDGPKSRQQRKPRKKPRDPGVSKAAEVRARKALARAKARNEK